MNMRMVLGRGLALGVLALAPLPAMATKVSTPEAAGLSILTYNVEGLPWPVRFGRAAKLARISSTLNGLRAHGRQPHVIVLQEAFSPEAKAIARQAGYRYVVDGPSKTLAGASAQTAADRAFAAGASLWRGETQGKWLDSGLRIASDYPIVAVRRMAYPAFACAGFDCLANKGALAVMIRVPGVADPVSLVATHLNSRVASHASNERALYAYQRQMDALGTFVRDVVPAHDPFILAGDLNVGPKIERRAYLARSTALWRTDAPLNVAMTACLPDPACAKGNIADLRFSNRRARDWQFYSPGPRTGVKIAAINGLFGRDPSGAMLSDHVGYVASYLLTAAKTAAPITVASR
ncbi:sphingomyelin phosphodiesterase [Sphingomonas sp.]|uniref:sphingomyelin phosphodiesterase n=1 Tax=Sphingomonas sp. TaxID=28214 RepID=UPI000DB6FC49|nr:sphingomyelin phosphodiesterase [Sphingomonas sp.]PZU06886.1 MAG: endonuclease/exonuclease/phosphatase [Sphingomonas sp.]